MAAANKTPQSTALFPLQNVPASGNVVGSDTAVTTTIGAAILIHFGRCSSTAFTVSPTFRLEGKFKNVAQGFWGVLQPYTPQLGASLTAQAVNGTCNAAQNVIPLASTTNFALQDIVYIKNTTIGNGEFGRVKSIVANTSITLEENLNNAQTGSTVYRAAEMYVTQLDLTSVTDIRLVVDNSANSTANGIDVEAWMVTFDAFS